MPHPLAQPPRSNIFLIICQLVSVCTPKKKSVVKQRYIKILKIAECRTVPSVHAKNISRTGEKPRFIKCVLRKNIDGIFNFHFTISSVWASKKKLYGSISYSSCQVQDISNLHLVSRVKERL